VTHALSLMGLAPADIRLPLVADRPETAAANAAALEGAGIRLAAPARADA
jgi:hypothetical protein